MKTRTWLTFWVLPFSLFLGLALTPGSASNIADSLTRSAPVELMRAGKELYEAHRFAEAAAAWQQAAGIYENLGDGSQRAIALSNLSAALQQLGRWEEAKSAVASSLKLLQAGAPGSATAVQRARALNTQGSLQLATGQPEQALASWQQAADAYRQVGDRAGAASATINQAQALQALGQYRRALRALELVSQTLEPQPDSPLKAAGLRSLGDALRLTGDLKRSQQVLQQSLDIAQRLLSKQAESDALFSLGNTAYASQEHAAALDYFQQAFTESTSPKTKAESLLNQLSLLVESKNWPAARSLLPQIQLQIASLPQSRTSVYAQINFAENLRKLSEDRSNEVSTEEIARLLATAAQQASNLGDTRSEAYALGFLGELYERTQQWSYAQKLTAQALLKAQAINAPDIAYRWQWQLGRLLKARGDVEGAISAYSQAVSTLQSLRTDLVAINQELQFSFRESVEPVYRQLVELLLDKQPSQKNLKQARAVIESLQLAELDNFFRDACLDTKPVEIDRVDPKAAVFYPIILENRLAVILSLPGENLRYWAVPLEAGKVEETLIELRKALVTRTSKDFLPLSQKVYQWLIQPAEADLASSKIETLVFILDGALRNIPMAALHDGKQYLVEKYGIALTPGLQLLEAKPLQRGQLKALTAGLTEERSGFSALPNVAVEVERIQSQLPGEVLLNQQFTSKALQKEISQSSFPVIHIATHGEFSSKAEDTFILTWDGRINVTEFDSLLRASDERRSNNRAIELLVLSACKTAAGDNRAALGLAGVAVRAGARSTLATLWYINDAATAPLMSEFYRELTDAKVTKAEALRRAQLSLLKYPEYRHPIYWSPYVLVGNWL
ncbi:CHAT domain-containing protein [Kamptonema formosum]|uniref:CHAT domain-containing protein n=1 Tax=Kamptonema formosum TaxID=331992 RepID=UPI00034CA1A9|nr:CHAT domain-containing protein [Oscillatoria sp. PCC 10802]